MASKTGAQESYGPVLAALATMQSNVSTKDKTAAHEYLERFQKSVYKSKYCDRWEMADNVFQTEAWNTTHSMLQSTSTTVEAKLFAATTLKGKV